MKKLIPIILIGLMVPIFAQAGILEWWNDLWAKDNLGATICFPYQGCTGKDTSAWTGNVYVTSGVWGTTTAGSGAFTTTTINGLSSTAYTFSAGGANLSVATSGSDTITYTWTDPGYATTGNAGFSWASSSYNWSTTTAAQIGTLTNLKWCSSDGSKINCTENAPAGGGVSSLNSLTGDLTLWGTSPLTVSASGTVGLLFAFTEADPVWLSEKSGYLTTSTAASTYLATGTAASTYQPIGSYATTGTSGLTNYYTKSDINASTTSWLADTKWDGGSTGLVAATGRTSLGLGDSAVLASSTWVKTETDPLWTASSTNWGNWNTAYSWGNHASAGYATTGTVGLTNYYTSTYTDSNFLATGTAASTYYLQSNPAGYISDGNTGWDNSYGYITATTTGLQNYLSSSTIVSTYLPISASNTFAWRANNLSDLANTSTARTNLGLGTMALENTGSYYTTSTATSSFVSRANWTTIDNYPTACSGNNWVQGIGDTLTCNQLGFSNLSGSATYLQLPADIASSSTPLNTFTGTLNGASTTAAGSSGWIQYNADGVFGAEDGFEYNTTTNTLTVGITSSSYFLGAGSIAISNSVSAADASNLLLNGTNTQVKLNVYGASSIGSNNSAASIFIVPKWTEASSGFHPLISGLAIKTPSITNGIASTSYTSTLYIEGASSAGTTSNYALWVDAGDVRFDGNLAVSGTSSLGTVASGTWNGATIGYGYLPTNLASSSSALGFFTGTLNIASTTGALNISTQSNLSAGRSLTTSTAATIDVDAELYTRTATINFVNNTTTEAARRGTFRPSSAITITEIGCYTNGATAVLAFYESAQASPNASSTTILGSITCDSDSASTTSFTDATIASEDLVTGFITSISGASTTVAYVKYTIDD